MPPQVSSQIATVSSRPTDDWLKVQPQSLNRLKLHPTVLQLRHAHLARAAISGRLKSQPRARVKAEAVDFCDDRRTGPWA